MMQTFQTKEDIPKLYLLPDILHFNKENNL